MEETIVMPGDILNGVTSDKEKLILGPGLKRDMDNVVATKCGILKKREPNIYWVNSHQKKYIPVRGERVIGIVTARTSEMLRVDIGSSEPASLSLLAFEGATKRNKPILQVGDLVYGQVVVACKDMEPELVCVDKHGKKARLGPLPDGGFVFTSSLELARKVLSPNCPLFEQLGKKITFEVAMGLNGRIWVKSTSVNGTMLVYNAILLSEHMTVSEMQDMCNKLFI